MEAAQAFLSRFKKGGSSKYATVANTDLHDAAAFAIAEDDDDQIERMTIDELSQMHDDLLQQASAALSSTESSVNWLKQEREQAAVQVRALTGDGPTPTLNLGELPQRRRGCAAICHRLSRFCGVRGS